MGDPSFIHLCKKLANASLCQDFDDRNNSEKIYTLYVHNEAFPKTGSIIEEVKNSSESAMKRAETAFNEMKVISREIKEAYHALTSSLSG